LMTSGTMQAWVIRPDRLGDPVDAMKLETIGVPEPGAGEVLVRVMAAGVNYNGVWASMGLPVSIFRYTGYDFHIGGSDASGIVEAVGAGVTRWKPGDEVVIHCNQSCGECAECNGFDPMACTRQKIWAYESNWGSFAEYCLVQAQQLLRKPGRLTWEEAASYGLTYFTAYRMLVDRAEVRAGDNVLVWGAGGGLGTFAVQLCRLLGANACAVVSSDDKIELVRGLGATSVIDRREFALHDPDTGERNFDEIKRFGKAIRELTGGSDPDVVFEHVGAATFFTSVFVCKTFGRIVICGATSGFQLDFDVRYLWMRQKTILGSHFANAYECERANRLIAEGKIEPVLSRVFPFSECPAPHQMMKENQHVGKMVVLVGAEREGLGRRDG
jgi:crotonyl-CoA carboxylase/reductase